MRNLQPEFNDTPHVKGIVSMARGDDPGQRRHVVLHRRSARTRCSTASTRRSRRVVDGLPVVDAIEQVPVNGEAPVTRVEVKHVRVEQRPA